MIDMIYRQSSEYRNNKRLMKNTPFKTSDTVSGEMKVVEKYWGCPCITLCTVWTFRGRMCC